MTEITILVPKAYRDRMVPAADGRIWCFSSSTLAVVLGYACTLHGAIKLLEAFDKQAQRRQIIADKIQQNIDKQKDVDND